MWPMMTVIIEKPVPVEQHRRAVAQEAAQHIHAGAEDGLPHERQRAAAEGVGEADDELDCAGEERCHCRARDAERGKAELAEDENIVANGVAEHRDGEDDHAETRIFNAALHTDVDGRDRIEDVGKTDDAEVRLGERDKSCIVRDEVEHLRGEGAEDDGKEHAHAACDEKADAHHAVDALAVTVAPVLADEHARAALQAEDNELDDEDRHICHRDGGHLVTAEKTDHEGIQKAEGRGDQILHDDRQRQ